METLLADLQRHFVTLRGLASRIDHTNLALDATEYEICLLCAQAKHYGFASVCVRLEWVPLVAELLRGSTVRVCTVISFHRGRNSIKEKITEARTAIARGAQDIDWVFGYENVPECYGKDPKTIVHLEVEAIGTLAREFPNIVFKVVVECCALTFMQNVWICELLLRERTIQFIKTSTGSGEALLKNGPTGATVEDMGAFARMIANFSSPMRINASGDIRTLRALVRLSDAGGVCLTRFGISHECAVAIMMAALDVGLPDQQDR